MTGTKRKSASSAQQVPVVRKIDEAVRQFRKLVNSRPPWQNRDFSHLVVQQSEYASITQEFGGFELTEGRAFEIGCGQRPYRLFNLIASGVDATGVDLDHVFLSLRPRSVVESLVSNGLERTAKTVARYLLFDFTENRSLKNFLSEKSGRRFEWAVRNISQGNAASAAVWPDEEIDFVYSEDVFEHIPANDLEGVCQQICNQLSSRGIAVIRPMVFTGIQGGHNVEWYRLDPEIQRVCQPWDHLRENRHPANTFLNRMSLADYRALFSRYFEILDEKVIIPNEGREFLTDEIRAELSEYPDEELFSNRIRFILKPRSAAQLPAGRRDAA